LKRLKLQPRRRLKAQSGESRYAYQFGEDSEHDGEVLETLIRQVAGYAGVNVVNVVFGKGRGAFGNPELFEIRDLSAALKLLSPKLSRQLVAATELDEVHIGGVGSGHLELVEVIDTAPNALPRAARKLG